MIVGRGDVIGRSGAIGDEDGKVIGWREESEGG
jgi:hypothetical protein